MMKRVALKRIAKRCWMVGISLLIGMSFTNQVYAKDIYKSNRDESLKYYSQYDGDELSDYNCGPATVKMVMSMSKDVENIRLADIRNSIETKAKVIYTSELKNMLEIFEIPYQERSFEGIQTLVDTVDEGDVAIVCINMSEILSVKKDGEQIGKNTNSLTTGHYVVVTGYAYKDEKKYFEVLDPYNKKVGTKHIYSEISYFPAEELENAINKWYQRIFEIDMKNESIPRLVDIY